MHSIFFSAIRDFDSILLQSNCLDSILNIHLKSMMKYQLSGSTKLYLHCIYHRLKKTTTMNSKNLPIPGENFIPRGATNIMSNQNVAFNFPFKFKQKMVRIRRKSLDRKTVNCLRRCLANRTCRLVIKWIDRQEQIFSILFKHKKSPDWSRNYLALFKELDKISESKYEKYKNESDYDQAGKRRCKANLRKLCQDGKLEKIRKIEIDKCTKEVHYKFTDETSNEQTSSMVNDWINAALISNDDFCFSNNETEHEGNVWINASLNSNDNFCFSNKETEHESYSTFAGNKEIKDDSEEPPIKSFNDIDMNNEVYCTDENGYVYLVSASPEENINIDYSNSSSNTDSLPLMKENEDMNFITSMSNSSINMAAMLSNEASQDISDLMEMVELEKNNAIARDNLPLWSEGWTPNINSDLMEMVELEKNDAIAMDNLPLWGEGCILNINSGMNINDVANEL
ncbi:uncharacterized protein [Parasteatoda tepidariorum]|uniref:uncharacterized protein isoform X2 n=1 Tax=Parasteatoda tepidariorum TaxID=114398 RepID=UPI00077FBE67